MVIICCVLFQTLVLQGYFGPADSQSDSGGRRPLTSLRDDKATKIYEMLHEFRKVHDETSLHNYGNISASYNSSALCEKQFVVGTYYCPVQVGNRVTELLNGLATAVILNRPFLWKFCDDRSYCKGSSLSKCQESIVRHKWIPSYTAVAQFMKSDPQASKCDKNIASVLHEYSGADRGVPRADEVVACCGLHNVKSRFMEIATVERHEVFALILKGSNLDIESRKRAELLFSMGENFAFGAIFRFAFQFSKKVLDLNHGLLKKFLPFKLRPQTTTAPAPASATVPLSIGASSSISSNNGTEIVSHSNKNTSSNSNSSSGTSAPPAAVTITRGSDTESSGILYGLPPQDTLVIAVHLRHMQDGDDGSKDIGERSCILKVIQKFVNLSTGNASATAAGSSAGSSEGSSSSVGTGTAGVPLFSKCVVLLASDRTKAVIRNKDIISKEFGCEVVYRDEDDVAAKAASQGAQALTNEHGSNADSIVSMADLELMSHAHVFIGSAYQGQYSLLTSTFSLLAAGLAATNPLARSRARHLNRIFPGGLDTPNFWVPSCSGKMFGSRLEIEEAYSATDLKQHANSNFLKPYFSLNYSSESFAWDCPSVWAKKSLPNVCSKPTPTPSSS